MGKVILENLIPLLFAVLTPVVLLFARKALQELAKKMKLDGAVKYEAKVDALIIKGIKAAEQKAINYAKTDDAKKTAGQKKLDSVMEFVNAQLKEHKLDEKAAKQLEMLIEAKIFDGTNNIDPSIPTTKAELPAAKTEG